FKPGQTVYPKSGSPYKFIVAGVHGDDLWLKIVGGENATVFLAKSESYSATNPNAEPTPQKCPFCGSESRGNKHSGRHWFDCPETYCRLIGPERKTRLEAIQAWNSIRVVATTLDDLDGTKDRPIELDREQTKSLRAALT